MDLTAALADIDNTIAAGSPLGGGGASAVIAAATAYHACICRYAPPGSTYRAQADKFVALPPRRKNAGDTYPDQALVGVLAALRADVANGRLARFEEIVRADVFADLLQQAEHLHGERYSRAATVVAGSALEEHLKRLAAKHGTGSLRVDGTSKKASVMNAELKAAGVYAETQRATVESWQKLRNDAAHGALGFEAPDTSLVANVEPLIVGVRGFIANYPA